MPGVGSVANFDPGGNTSVWISPAYERDYREWIEKGLFEEVLARSQASLSKALARQHPALIASGLSGLATCYYTRGAVGLLEKDASAWRDIQAGYSAHLYS